jgi:flagellar basal body-associated protein FliL
MAEEQEQGVEKKKLPLKTIIVLAAALLIEAGAFTAAILLSGGPADVAAATDEQIKAAEANELVEELVVSGSFQNIKSGRSFLYDTEVYIKVRRKYQEEVKEELEEKRAAITMAIATIIRSSEPIHLKEDGLLTLTRQITAALSQVLGVDEESGKTKIEEVSIPKFIRYLSDI